MIADPDKIGGHTERSSLGQFLPGNPGGPGRGQANREYRDVFRRVVTAQEFEAVLRVVIDQAKDGAPWACCEILNRALGKPKPTDDDAAEDFRNAVAFTLNLTRRQNEPSTS